MPGSTAPECRTHGIHFHQFDGGRGGRIRTCDFLVPNCQSDPVQNGTEQHRCTVSESSCAVLVLSVPLPLSPCKFVPSGVVASQSTSQFLGRFRRATHCPYSFSSTTLPMPALAGINGWLDCAIAGSIFLVAGCRVGDHSPRDPAGRMVPNRVNLRRWAAYWHGGRRANPESPLPSTCR
jgi:hypothetical protein